MTTPSSTAERGVSAISDDAIGAGWDAAKARMSHDPYTPKEAFWAGALFAQSRQPSAQGWERVASSGLVEVLRGGRQCDEDGSEIIMSRQACCEAADIIESLATPPATSSMKEAVPDDVWEALQRLIENGGSMGPASRDDALLVAKHRRFLMTAPPPAGGGKEALSDAERLADDDEMHAVWTRVSGGDPDGWPVAREFALALRAGKKG